jgi:hypothetical protein
VKMTTVTQRALPPGGSTSLPSTVWVVTTFTTCRVLWIDGRWEGATEYHAKMTGLVAVEDGTPRRGTRMAHRC